MRTLLSTEFVQNSGLVPKACGAVNNTRLADDPALEIKKSPASFLRKAINPI